MDVLKNIFADIWLLILARNASIYFPFVFLCLFSHVTISVALKHFPPVRLKFQNQAHKSDVSVPAFGITKEIRP